MFCLSLNFVCGLFIDIVDKLKELHIYIYCLTCYIIDTLVNNSCSGFFFPHRLADFVIYKLKEMGKISQEDISLVMEEFEDLDVDQSGTLSASDIALAQSSQTKR